jgi:hypothetical protein
MALIGETNGYECDGIKRSRYNQNDPKDHGYPDRGRRSIILTLTHYISKILVEILEESGGLLD